MIKCNSQVIGRNFVCTGFFKFVTGLFRLYKAGEAKGWFNFVNHFFKLPVAFVLKSPGNFVHHNFYLVDGRLEDFFDISEVIFIHAKQKLPIDTIVENELFGQKRISHRNRIGQTAL